MEGTLQSDTVGSPKTVQRCEYCFVNILDGVHHFCIQHGIAAFRACVYHQACSPIFEFKVEGGVHVLNWSSSGYEMVTDGQKLVSPATNGIMPFEKIGDLVVASYVASSFKRFSIIFANKNKLQWKCMFRIETSADGLKFHKMGTHLDLTTGQIPDELKFNTIGVLGIIPKSVGMHFSDFAFEDGFNGYTWSQLIANQDEVKVKNLFISKKT